MCVRAAAAAVAAAVAATAAAAVAAAPESAAESAVLVAVAAAASPVGDECPESGGSAPTGSRSWPGVSISGGGDAAARTGDASMGVLGGVFFAILKWFVVLYAMQILRRLRILLAF